MGQRPALTTRSTVDITRKRHPVQPVTHRRHAMASTTEETTADSTSHRLRLAGISATTLIVGAAAIATIFAVDRPSETSRSQDHGTHITYTSTRAMAEKIGCSSSFTTPAYRGSSKDAGQCTIANGKLVQMRVYPLPDEATAWLDGSSGQDHDEIGVSGGTWAAMISTTNTSTANSVVQPLTTP